MPLLDSTEQWYEELRQDELRMLEHNRAGEFPQGPAWYYHLRLADNADQCFQRIMQLVTLILSTPRYAWPSEEQWQFQLPSWFLKKTTQRQPEEVDRMMQQVPSHLWSQLAWSLDSWLDVLHDREWRWWSYLRMERDMKIFFELTGWPALLDTFDFLVSAADATILRQHRWPAPDEEPP